MKRLTYLKGKNVNSRENQLQGKMGIDTIDVKILRTLLRESRTSFTDIAKDCKISVAAVRMRYKQLWKSGIIVGEIMQVNPQSLGYKCIADLGVIADINSEKKVIDFLESRPYVLHVLRDFGKYNLAVKVTLSDMDEFAKILDDLEANPLIKQVDAMIWAEVVNMDHAENLVLNQQIEKRNINSSQTIERELVDIDETDRRIAKILSQNSRRPFKKIAEEIGISTKNVIQRYRRLKGSVLRLSTIQVNLKKLGYNATCNIFIKAQNRSQLQGICSEIFSIPNLIVSIRLIGSYDLLVIFALEDFESLFNLKEKINKIPGLEKVDLYINRNFPAWPLNMFYPLLDERVC